MPLNSSSRCALAAALAVCATAADTQAGAWSLEPSYQSIGTGDVLDVLRAGWSLAHRWIEQGTTIAPAVMAGLAIVVVVPALAIVGLIVRLATSWQRSVGPEPGNAPRPGTGWLRIDGDPRPRRIAREMVRIGQQEDNEVCIDHASINRYHAVIERTPEAEFFITDLTGPDGAGVAVNGRRINRSALSDGDRIAIGTVTFRFEMQPVVGTHAF